MEQGQQQYEVAIIGGGLAGLSCAIQLGRAGHSVVLLEKESYPFHKVCGEYISMESWNFLQQLGLPLEGMKLPVIDRLFLTAPNGRSFSTKLPLGGFGISRYKLDHQLAGLARQNGVLVLEGTKAKEVVYDDGFQIRFSPGKAGAEMITAKVCCAAFGKRSNLDVKWKRSFLDHQDRKLDNYVGVKYHVRAHWEENVIGLHNFKNGYCGISKIEDGKYCLCYMTRSENLRNCNNDMKQLEEKILGQNHHLKKIFSEASIVGEFPVTISQINFHKKTQIENHILMLGDAAGMITPLCGNGMSIALHSGKIASHLIGQFLKGGISRTEMESRYAGQWKRYFSRRLKTGRVLQKFFGSEKLGNFFVSLFRAFPVLARPVIRMTHGQPF